MSTKDIARVGVGGAVLLFALACGACGGGASAAPAATSTATSATEPTPTATASSDPAPSTTVQPTGDAPPPSDADVESRVRAAVMRDVKGSFGAQNVGVTVVAGRVTLKGAVASEAEHGRVVAAARAVSGVKGIDDQLAIAK